MSESEQTKLIQIKEIISQWETLEELDWNDQINDKGQTLLHRVFTEVDQSNKDLNAGITDIINWCFDQGHDPDIKDNDNNTAIQYAINSTDCHIWVELLVSRGSGLTPDLFEKAMEKKNLKLIITLIKLGAQPTKKHLKVLYTKGDGTVFWLENYSRLYRQLEKLSELSAYEQKLIDTFLDRANQLDVCKNLGIVYPINETTDYFKWNQSFDSITKELAKKGTSFGSKPTIKPEYNSIDLMYFTVQHMNEYTHNTIFLRYYNYSLICRLITEYMIVSTN